MLILMMIIILSMIRIMNWITFLIVALKPTSKIDELQFTELINLNVFGCDVPMDNVVLLMESV